MQTIIRCKHIIRIGAVSYERDTFRGKTVCDGDWIYGGITWNPSRKKVFIHTKWDEGEVIPETVGQYTGMTDKNGTRIFEGDILSAHLDDGYPENETLLEVVWHNNGWYGKNGKFFDDFDNGEVQSN